MFLDTLAWKKNLFNKKFKTENMFNKYRQVQTFLWSLNAAAHVSTSAPELQEADDFN